MISGEKCSGCGACKQICPHHAIKMDENSEGFLYPIVDEKKCVTCGLCEKACPYLAERYYENTSSIKVAYMAYNKYSQDSIDCATIGLCTAISKEVFQKGWKVFGCYLNEEDWSCCHKMAEKIEDIDSFRNSKYIQSNTKNTFSLVKKCLNSDENVLYIGTPCQIAGLKGFLSREYAGLYTIELICHGCSSSKVLKEEVSYYEKLYGGNLHNFKFRSKNKYPWAVGVVFAFDINDGSCDKHYEIGASSGSPTYMCFKKEINLRVSCYNCPFRGKNRYGDLTIGDAWSLVDSKKVKTSKTDKYGLAEVFLNTEKGKDLCSYVNKSFSFYIFPWENAFGQPSLKPSSRTVPSSRKELFRKLGAMEYGQLVSDLLHVDLEKERVNEEKVFQNKVKQRKRNNLIKSLLFYRYLMRLTIVERYVSAFRKRYGWTIKTK